MTTTLTLIVPVLNESQQIPVFLEQIDRALKNESIRWKALFVDDGSTDETATEIKKLQYDSWPIDVVVLSRNFGKEAALTAGIDYATGDVLVPMDVDLQHPPDVIPKMLERYRAGAEVVLARRRSRHEESIFKKLSARIYYKIMGLVSDVEIPRNVGDFRLLDSRAADAIRNLRERSRYMKGLFAWPGFKSETVEYDQPEREIGVSRQSLSKLFRLAFDGLVSFSSLPLRIWSFIGIVIAGLAMLYMSWIVVSTLAFGRDVPGYTSIMTTILFMGGLQLLSVGVLGEYIARIFTEVKQRPIYVVSEHQRHDADAIQNRETKANA